MLERMKSLLKRYDEWWESVGIKPNDVRCGTPILRYDPEQDKSRIVGVEIRRAYDFEA